jgi:hypothetical protein
MIIGYSVLYIDDDIGAGDMLWERRVVYSAWEDALKNAQKMAEKQKERWGEDCYFISLSKSTSKNDCESRGNTKVYQINHKKLEIIGEVFIVPVFNE